jgi:hypothetical protein
MPSAGETPGPRLLPVCGAVPGPTDESPEYPVGIFCTLPVGHTGDHSDRGENGGYRWEQSIEQGPWNPVSGWDMNWRACGAFYPASPCSLRCGRTLRHAGPHALLNGAAGVTQVWEQPPVPGMFAERCSAWLASVELGCELLADHTGNHEVLKLSTPSRLYRWTDMRCGALLPAHLRPTRHPETRCDLPSDHSGGHQTHDGDGDVRHSWFATADSPVASTAEAEATSRAATSPLCGAEGRWSIPDRAPLHCELANGHPGEHRSLHEGTPWFWTQADLGRCPARYSDDERDRMGRQVYECELRRGHGGAHRTTSTAALVSWSDEFSDRRHDADVLRLRMEAENYRAAAENQQRQALASGRALELLQTRAADLSQRLRIEQGSSKLVNRYLGDLPGLVVGLQAAEAFARWVIDVCFPPCPHCGERKGWVSAPLGPTPGQINRALVLGELALGTSGLPIEEDT